MCTDCGCSDVKSVKLEGTTIALESFSSSVDLPRRSAASSSEVVEGKRNIGLKMKGMGRQGRMGAKAIN